MSIKLYSGPLSLFSHKVEIVLREKKLPFEREMVPFNQATGYSPKHPEVLKHNPKGQVPVLIDDDLVLFDSTLIIEYLEDAYPEPALLPKDPKMRAQCRLLELQADEVLLPLVVKLMYRTDPPNPDADPVLQEQKETEGALAEREIEGFYRQLDERLIDRNYFFGQFSAADIAMFMTVLFVLRLQGADLSGFNRLSVWYERVMSRPSVKPVAEGVAKADQVLSEH